MERAVVDDITFYFGGNVMTGDPFLESPVNFSGPISNMQIKFLIIRGACVPSVFPERYKTNSHWKGTRFVVGNKVL